MVSGVSTGMMHVGKNTVRSVYGNIHVEAVLVVNAALRKRLEKHLRTWHVSPSAMAGHITCALSSNITYLPT